MWPKQCMFIAIILCLHVEMNAQRGGCAHGSECVPFYLCSDNKIISSKATIEKIVSGLDLDNAPDACDKNPMTQCCSYPVDELPDCGYSNPKGVGYYSTNLNESQAQFGEFPWVVAVMIEVHQDDWYFNVYQGVGALIHPSVVLTSAYNIKKDPSAVFKIRAGEWNTTSMDEFFPHQDRNVIETITHPYYQGPDSVLYDFALIFLDKPVNTAANIATACLPPQDYVFEESTCFALGWGKNEFGKNGTYQKIMKKLTFPIITDDECESAIASINRPNSGFRLDSKFICTLGEGSAGLCNGDEGSPLICPIPGAQNRFYQAGIFSWHTRCGEHEMPNVFTKVSPLRTWIDEQMRLKNLNSSSYSVTV